MTATTGGIEDWLTKMPLVAILRGLVPERAAEYGLALAEAGFCIMEVPLNGERAFEAIGALEAALGRHVLVGAGTVLTVDEVRRAHDSGAQLIVSPNVNPDVIRATHARGLISVPGVSTPTEALLAIGAGASALKLFPAEASSPRALSALLSVIGSIPVLPVGGIAADAMEVWWRAGARGFGAGSALFKPSFEVGEVAERAKAFVDRMRELTAAKGDGWL
jgi:2-dehydro-3-deoxyphosphogalactonate aldolase